MPPTTSLASHRYYSSFQGRWSSAAVRFSFGGLRLPAWLGFHLYTTVECHLGSDPPRVCHVSSMRPFRIPVVRLQEDFLLDPNGTDCTAAVTLTRPPLFRPVIARVVGTVSVEPVRAAQYLYRFEVLGLRWQVQIRTAWRDDHLEVTQAIGPITVVHHLRRS